jgi:uncharacterized protein (DUF2249 family)
MKPIVHLNLSQEEIPCSVRQQLVVKTWNMLGEGDAFSFEIDQDPSGILKQLHVMGGDAMMCGTEIRGPDDYVVVVTHIPERMLSTT